MQASGQGIELTLSPDARITYRLSGTGSSGATLRVYLERFIAPDGDVDGDPTPVLDPFVGGVAGLRRR